MYEDTLNIMEPCALYQVEGRGQYEEVARLVYDLFLMAGKPSDDVSKCARYSYLAFAGEGYDGFHDTIEFIETLDTWTPWQVPRWAIEIAKNISSIVRKAESIGKEKGYNSGMVIGKSFVKRLATGDITSTDFEKAEGKTPGSLQPREW